MNIQSCEASKRIRKKKTLKKSITKSIKAKVVKEIESSAYFAKVLGLALNQLITIVHADVDTFTAEQKKKLYQDDLNRLKQYARDNGFMTAFIWSRESDRQTGNREHLHVFIHIPEMLQANLKRVVEKWPADVHICNATYNKQRLSSGKTKSTIGYLLKNSPQAAWGTTRMHKAGGPIAGKRCGCSQNINMKSQEIHKHGKVIFDKVRRNQEVDSCHLIQGI